MGIKSFFAKMAGKKGTAAVEPVNRASKKGNEKDSLKDNTDSSLENALVSKVKPAEKKDAIEKLQDGFERLVGELEGINTSLAKQVDQHEQIAKRMEDFAKIVESLPQAIEEQKRVFTAILDDLKEKESKFVEMISKIPEESHKQNETLSSMKDQLETASRASDSMAKQFDSFGHTLESLNSHANSQKETVNRISTMYSESESFYKQTLKSIQNRFLWMSVSMVALGVVAVGTIVVAVLVSMGKI